MTVTIGTARAAEVDSVASLWHQGWHDAHADIVPRALTELRTAASFRERVTRDHAQIRVARRDGSLLGLCFTRVDELYQMYVAAEARGLGVAQRLMSDAEQRMRANGVSRAWLACAIGNERAARFYRKCGWVLARNDVEEFETGNGPFAMEIWRFEKALSG